MFNKRRDIGSERNPKRSGIAPELFRLFKFGPESVLLNQIEMISFGKTNSFLTKLKQTAFNKTNSGKIPKRFAFRSDPISERLWNVCSLLF
jgi:hypothetical protein